MVYTIAVAIASMWMIFMSINMTVKVGSGYYMAVLLYKIIPGVTGNVLLFFLIAQYMGWPVQ